MERGYFGDVEIYSYEFSWEIIVVGKERVDGSLNWDYLVVYLFINIYFVDITF